MSKTRKEERRDERTAKILLMTAIISLMGSIITLITTLVR